MRLTTTVRNPGNVVKLDFAQFTWTLSVERLLRPSSEEPIESETIYGTYSETPVAEPEWDWILRNDESLRANYPGQWVGVLGNRVVAIGRDELETLRKAEALGYANIFTYYVPTDHEPAPVVITGAAR